MSTITIDDVTALLGRDITADESTRVARLIDYAEAAVEDELPGFSIAAGNEEVEVVAHGELWTPRYPVTAINSLTVDGMTADAASYRCSDKGRFERVRTFPAFNAPWFRWWCDESVVTIDYDFGLEPPPFSIVNAVAASVAAVLQRQAVNADGLTEKSETIDGYSYTDQFDRDAARIGVLSVDPAGLRGWKRNRQVSVPLVSD